MVDIKDLKDPSPWNPLINSAVDLKHLGKLCEELAELQAAIARCMIQGVEGVEPVTGKPNRQWVEEEIADVQANISLCIKRFNFKVMNERFDRKIQHLSRWHNMETV